MQGTLLVYTILEHRANGNALLPGGALWREALLFCRQPVSYVACLCSLLYSMSINFMQAIFTFLFAGLSVVSPSSPGL